MIDGWKLRKDALILPATVDQARPGDAMVGDAERHHRNT